MTRFQVKIKGDDLGRAQAALNEAGIPTIASGRGARELLPGGRVRRRFVRSPFLAILIVIVLAFIAQRLISPADDQHAPTYDQFLVQVHDTPASIEKVTLDPNDTAVEVAQRNGEEYEIGYPPSAEESLVSTLVQQRIETVVEETGGSSLLSLIAYVLPFLLFFGFWLFLMRRMQQGGGPVTSPMGGWQPQSLEAVVDAESAEGADHGVRSALPVDGAYRVGKPNPAE